MEDTLREVVTAAEEAAVNEHKVSKEVVETVRRMISSPHERIEHWRTVYSLHIEA